jgi:hypothetical protein
VAYRLKLHESSVAPYLFSLPLTREGRITLFASLHDICQFADQLRNDPARRLLPGSEYFCIDLVFRDSGNGILHNLRLIISDAAAHYGILLVDYVEDETGTPFG